MLGEPAGSDPDSRLCCRPKSGRHPLGKRFVPKTAELDPAEPKPHKQWDGARVWLRLVPSRYCSPRAPVPCCAPP